MTWSTPTRWMLLAVSAAGTVVFAQKRVTPPPPAPIVRRPAPPVEHPVQTPPSSTLKPIQRHENPGQKVQGEHLAGWLDHHRNLTPQQQQQALEKEPGFHDLPSQTQQRMRDRLTQIDNMPPEQRAKLLSRTEALEKLSPEQRVQVRDSVMQLAQLPPDRRKMVRRTFLSMRSMTPAQRQTYLNSPELKSQFSDSERATLSGLISVEPYTPDAQP